jgi:hypothetical protein
MLVILHSTAIVYGLGTAIGNNDDLNNYTAPGVYRVTSMSQAQSTSNIPETQAGRLEVRQTSGNYIIQYYYPYRDVDRFYMRRYTDAWSPWYRYNGVEVT